ncbi:MAG: glutamine-hydrolyzing carbamoyl-phosphate synthase small subunit [Spirochaetia bacterium]
MHELCYLVLEDGQVYSGKSFGFPAPQAASLLKDDVLFKCAGEVVFHTGMTGYTEILTDPSYTGQLVLMTYPHMGNYGTVSQWNENSFGRNPQAPDIQASGFITRSLYTGPVPEGRLTLHQWMEANKTPGIYNIDTRALTLDIRSNGSRNGIIVTPKDPEQGLSEEERKNAVKYISSFPSMEGRDLVNSVGIEEIRTIPAQESDMTFVLYDCGIKMNIIRELTKRKVSVTLVPSRFPAEKLLDLNPEGVLFSNGPGDPGVLKEQVEVIKKTVGKIPVFGICMGHQLISLALGAKTEKMKFGHHGANHPVRDEFTKSVFVTSQNHGFVVTNKSIPKNVDIWFSNANDGSVEGIRHKELPVMCVQFHPEAAPGPYDATWIFDDFITCAKDNRSKE